MPDIRGRESVQALRVSHVVLEIVFKDHYAPNDGKVRCVPTNRITPAEWTHLVMLGIPDIEMQLVDYLVAEESHQPTKD